MAENGARGHWKMARGHGNIFCVLLPFSNVLLLHFLLSLAFKKAVTTGRSKTARRTEKLDEDRFDYFLYLLKSDGKSCCNFFLRVKRAKKHCNVIFHHFSRGLGCN